MADNKERDIWAELRKPFDPKAVGKLPKGNIQLDYVGHAAVTDRLNTVDPTWTWEPMATDESGLPLLTDTHDNFNKPLRGLWIRLTINGVTRPAFGDGKTEKEAIGDAIRNGAMRFGVALDLWSKDELESNIEHPENKNKKAEPQPYNRDDFQPEPSRDIHEDVIEELITDDVLLKLGGEVKKKGIADMKKVNVILDELAKTKGISSAHNLTVTQARELFVQIKSETKEALDLLTENE